MKKIKVFAIDDHAIVLDGITAMFMGNKEIEIVATFTSGKRFLTQLKQHQPDVLLLDITLPELNGIELCKIITNQYPLIATLMLSAKTDEYSITESVKAGAKGFLSKSAPKQEIEKAIKWIYSGKMYFGKSINETIFKGYVKELTISKMQSQQATLTSREIEIIKLFSDGLLYKEVAHQLNISIKTVESYKAKIMKKIEARTTADLIKYAIKEGIVSLD